jgi:transcriptional regulator with XRE-family HTH domain
MANFAERLNEAIESRGVSQKWVADKANTTEATISRYAHGKASPTILVILKDIATALNVSSDYLIGLTNIPQSKDSLSEEEKTIISVWSKVSPSDKKVFFALLDRYLSDVEREKLQSESKK